MKINNYKSNLIQLLSSQIKAAFMLGITICFLNINVNAQLTGTIAIPSANYPTIKVAVDSLNLYGVAGGGGVTFNVTPGYTETLTARLNMTATGSFADPIVFQKNGVGANPIITSYAGANLASAATPDGMIALIGSDYVTFDGINLQEAAGNTTPTTIMEYGYGLFKASGTDGANNNTIKNCVITLNRNNTTGSTVGFINSAGAIGGSMGIALTNCSPTTATTAITVTALSGASSNNKFYSNTIQNVHCGISLAGFAGATPFTLCDFNNDIGGSSASTGNTIINFGGGTTPLTACAAVFFSNQWSLNFSYNICNNNNGSGVNHTATNRGIWAFASSNGASANINNNTLTITGASTTYDMGIDCEMTQTAASGNTISINNNTISINKTNSVAQLASAIWLNSSPATLNCNGNIITNFTCPSTATTDVGVIRSGFAGIGTLNINNNSISGVNFNAATGTDYIIGVTATVTTALNITGNNINGVTLTSATSKILRSIYVSTAVATCVNTISNNNFQNYSYSGGTPTGEFSLIYALGAPASWTINNNMLVGSLTIPTTTGALYLIYNSQSTSLGTVSGNNLTGTGITRTGTTSGLTYGYYNGSGPTGTFTFSNNTFSNVTIPSTSTGACYGIYLLTSTSCRQILQNNTFSNISSGTGTLYGINHNYGNTGSEISGNTVTGLTGAGTVAGINIGSTASITMDVFNNTVSGITTTGAASTVTGILHAAGTLSNIYKNKIYNINANSAGSTAIGLSVTAGTSVSLYNNLIGDLKTNAALTGADQIRGISLTGGTTVNAYYNTVNLNATTVGGANFGSSAISVSATPATITLRNNIFVNNSTPTGTGLAVAYRRASTALTNYAAVSNNNLFYAGSPSASKLIFHDGTNSDQTVMAYKARVFPADALSGTENPTFLSTSGASSNFLHIDPSVATNVESGAVNIAGITNDYDLETRQGNGGYVGTGTAPDIGADEFGGIAAAALAPPINFTSNTNTVNSFNITWDDNSVGEAGFVVFRSLNIGGPFNTIVGAVVSTTTGTTGTTYSLAQTGLLGGTTYYYQVVANNFSSSAPLLGNAATLGCGSGYSGTYTIPGTPFPSIKEALDSLVLYGMSGPVIFELDPTYVGAGETYPLLINNMIGCLNGTNTLTIRPNAAVATPLLITSANTTATIDINGANFVTIDGRPGGVGTNKYLIVENTSTNLGSAGNAILMRNEASNNKVTYCDVRSANANTAASGVFTLAGGVPGAIVIGSTTGAFGNDYDTISYCDIHSLTAGGNLGVGIYSGNGTTAGSNANNDFNTIDNCNIYDFYLATSNSAGIVISLGNNNWTITNNHVYQQSALNYAAGLPAVRGIWVTPNTGSLTSASGFNISGNYIGGNSANGTGLYTLTGTANYTFRAMDISVGLGTTTSIQNNTITNLNITGGFSGNSVYGIDVANGNVNMGTVTGNLIGSTAATGAITITSTVTGGSFIGLRSGAGGTINFSNNTVAGIDMIGNATTVATGFNGIAASGGANITVNNNTIGSATIANSINMVSTSATSTTAAAVRGIICNSGTAGANNTVTNNLVANINSNYSATGAQANTLIGISVTTGTSLVSGNIIRNLSSSSQTTSGGGTAAIVGIAYTSITAPAVISGNTIHTLKLTHPTTTAATANQAIFYGGPTTGTNNVIERNFIHSITLASPINSAAVISGMDVGTGVVTIKNNMIRLGLDEAGLSIGSPCLFRGITKNAATSNIYFNSIYIGGTGVDVTATNTFALVRTGTAVDDWRNNILVNERSNASTGGKHYAINLNATTTLTLNYNDYYGTGTGYVFGYNGTTDFASYATNWISGDASSYNLDPMFINPTGTSATVDLHIDPVNATIIEGTGTPIVSVTNDYDNQTRASLTPTDMGADAGDFVNLLCNGNPPNSTASFVGNSGPLCLTGIKTMTLSGFAAAPGMTYQWQESLVTGGPYTNVTSGTGGTTITYTTPTLTQTTYYVCVVTCSNGGAFTPSSELAVIVNNPQILSAPSVSRCGTGTVTLCATATPGTTVNWYSAPTGGTLLTTPYMNIPVTGFNNDIVAGGVGTNSILGTTYSFGPDGAGYTFIDNTYKYVSTNSLPSCFMPVNKLAPSLQTSGLTYEFQDYGNGATLNNNALSIANQSTTYTSPLPSSDTLTLTSPASYATLKVLYESVVNAAPLTVDATVTFTDATTQTFAGNTCVNWFTASGPAFRGMGRTSPGGSVECGSSPNFFPNMFELSLPISAPNQLKQVQSIAFSIPTVLSSGTTPANVNYFHAMAVGGNAPSTPGCFTTPIISSTTPYYVEASTTGGSNQISSNGVPNVTTSTQNGGVIFNLNVDVTINSIQVYSSAAGTATVTLMNAALVTLYTSAPMPIVNGGLSTPQTLSLGWSVPAGSGYRILVANTGNALGYGTGVFPYPMGNGVGSIVNGALNTGTSTLNYFVYNINTTAGCVSGRTMVNAVVTTPPAFAVTADQVVCNNAIAMLNVTSPSANYDSITWSPVSNLFIDAAATIPYTGGNEDTVYFQSATHSSNTITCTGNNTLAPFCSNIATTTVNVQPAAATVTLSAASLCYSGSVTLGLSPASPYAAGSIQWQVSADSITFSNIGGATNSTYSTPVIDTTTYYRAIIKNSNNDTCFYADAMVTVNEPAILTTTGASSCTPASLALNATATPGATINWYASATGGISLGSGISYSTPVINNTTTYYAAASNGGSSATTGMAAALPTATSGAGTTNFGIVFDALSAFTLNSVTIYPVSATSASGTVTIDVINSSSVVLNTITVNVVGSPGGAVAQVVNCNFNIAAGTNLKMRPGFTGISGLLFEPSASAPSGNYGYPYVVPGVLSINTSTLTAAPTNTPRNDLYYYFYNWNIATGCEGPRTPVLAAISTVPTSITTITNPTVTCTVGGVVTLSVASSNGVLAAGGSWEYQWMDETGTNILQPWNASSNFNVTAVSGLNKYRIYMRNTACLVDSGFDYASFIVGITGSAIGVSPTGCSPTGTIIVSATGSGVLTEWYNNDFTSPVLGAAAAVTGSASVAGGQCVITPNAASQSGAFQVFNPGAISASNYQIDFDLSVLPSGADGFSYSFGNDVNPTSVTPNFENGTGTKFKLSFDAYPNTGGNVPGLYLMYNCNTVNQPPIDPNVLAYVNNTSWLNANTHVTIKIDPAGFVTVSLNGIPVINNVALPSAYLTANRSNWTHVFKARTGAISEFHAIDNLAIKYNAFEYSINGPGGPWQASNAFSALPVGSYSVWARNPADITCTADLGIFVLDYPSTINTNATDTALCISGTSTLSMLPLLAGATYQWDSSSVSSSGPWFTISGATSATYLANISATTWYRCNISCGGTPIVGSPSVVRQILVNNPQVTNPVPGSRCGVGTVDLSATPSLGATLKWYANASGGNSLGTGNTFTTPSIAASTNFYVSASSGGGGSAYVGKVGIESTASNGGGLTTYVNFDAYSNFVLKTVDLFPYGTGAGTVTIELRTSTGTPIMNQTFNVTGTTSTASPAQTVTLNFPITPGSYRLGVNAWTGGVTNLYRDNTGTYPYTIPGVVSITGTSLAPYYYFFYNWGVTTGCESGRTLVPATVTVPPAVTISAASTTICAGTSTTLTASSLTNPNYDYEWTPGNYPGASVNVNPTVTTKYTVTATDNFGGTTFGCVDTETVTIVVNPLPPAVSVNPASQFLCGGGSQLLTANAVSLSSFVITGTSPTTSSGVPQPFYRTFEGFRMQYIIRASELTAAGVVAGNITSLSFNVSTLATTYAQWNHEGYTIRVGATNSTDLSAGWETVSNVVFGPVSYTPTAGTNNFPFNNSFNWNGISNIVVDVAFDNDPNNTCSTSTPICWGNNATCNIATAPFTAASRYYYSDNTTGSRDMYNYTATGTNLATRPIMTFGFAGSLNYSWAPASSLSATTGISVTATPSVNTVYTVTTTNIFGCTTTGTSQLDVIENPVPQLVEGTDTIVCSSSIGYYIHVKDAGPYSAGYPTGTMFEWVNYTPPTPGLDSIFVNISDNYTVIVYLPGNMGGCSKQSDTVFVDFGTAQSPLPYMQQDSVKCHGGSNGKAIAELVSGFVPNVNYKWYNSANVLVRNVTTNIGSDTLQNVPIGWYYLHVYNGLGSPQISCIAIDSIEVFQLDPVTVSGIVTDVTCYNTSTGTIQLTPGGGTDPYTYLWNNGSTAQNRSNLKKGTYFVTVFDHYGCTATASYTINQPNKLLINLNITHIKCGNGNNGVITANPIGGTTPFAYLWSNGQTGNKIMNLIAGTYTVTVTDAKNCVTSTVVTLTQNPPLVVIPVAGPGGTAFASVSGGVAPYTYLWNTLPAQTTATATGLIPCTTYKVKVSDAKNCSKIATITIPCPKGEVTEVDLEPFITAFPNPTTGLITINALNFDAEKVTVKMFDGIGQIVFDNQLQLINNATVIDLADLPKGIYVLNVMNGNKFKTIKIVLQ